MKKNQKGFTIVELLIAVTILSIVIAAVCGFIIVGSRSYAAGNSDISVQQEAQLALNQMSDVVIDTTRSVNYVGYDAGGATQKALKDAEFAFTPKDKSLVMFNGMVEETASAVPGGAPSKTVEAGNGNKHYHFYWSKDKETLYYAELDVDPTNDVDTSAIHFPAFDPTDPVGAGWVVLASHVTDFSVDLSQVEEKRVVQLALTFVDGVKEYVTSNNVTIRNKVGVNDAELDPINRRKTIAVAPRDFGVVIEPGETYHFSTPKVTGENVVDRSVTWSMATPGGNSPSGGTAFTDAANGILHVSSDEPAGKVTVVITTNAVGDDGLPASCTLEIEIKRATAVNLWKSADSNPENGANEISPGCTFTISADVVGNKIGEVCTVCSSPDIDIDKQVGNDENGTVYPWTIHNPPDHPWNPNNYIDIVESAPDHATFYVHPDIPTYDPNHPDVEYTATIACISLLSVTDNTYGRHYDYWVPGAIELKFVKGKKNISVSPSLRWGQKSTIMFEIDYPDDFNRTGQGYFLICARVREYGTEGGEKVMIYRTTGMNSEVTPDMFGVEDISRPWYLSLQVIDPGQQIQEGVGPSEQLERDLREQIWDPLVKNVIDDYLANSPGGTYNGKYPHTNKFESVINPPEIFYEYNGQSNLSGELNLKPMSTLVGPNEMNFRVDYVKNTRDERDRGEFSQQHVFFSVYKEKAGGDPEPIYVFQKKDGEHYNDESRKANYTGTQSPYNGALYFDVGNQGDARSRATNAIIKLDQNRKEMYSQAAGKYRIVPTIQYHNNPSADTSYTIYYANYQPWYWHMRVYDLPQSTIHFELKDGGNLELWSYYNNEFTKGEIYFPTPSDAGFSDYFDRENTNWHNAKKLDDFTKSIKGSTNTTVYSPSNMKCRYVANSKEYEVELFYDYKEPTWNRVVEVSAGIFKCAANGDKWTQIKPGDFDSRLESGNKNPQVNGGPTADINCTIWGQSYKGKIYIPLPSERGFVSKQWYGGFDLKKGAWQSKEWVSLKYLKDGEQNTWDLNSIKLSCYYDAGNDEYTMQLWAWDSNEWKYITAFKCKSTGNQWTQV